MKDYDALIRAINKQPQANMPGMKIAQVIAHTEGSGTNVFYDLQFDTTSEIVESCQALSSYVPHIGDIVRVMLVNGGSPLILGGVGLPAGALVSAAGIQAVFGGTTTFTNPTSYTNVLSTFWAQTKYMDAGASNFLIRMECTCYVSTITVIVEFAVELDDGTTVQDISICPAFFFNTANVHTTIVGSRIIQGLPPGDYLLRPRIRSIGGTAGTKTINFDTSDSFRIYGMETLQPPIF